MDPVAAAHAFEQDPWVRRNALVASVSVATHTDYAQVRVDHYSLGGFGVDDPSKDWDLLPEDARGPVRRLRAPTSETDPNPEPFDAETIVPPGTRFDDLEDYLEVGQRAFELCPIDVDIPYRRLREGADVARSHGLHVTAEGEVRGAVEWKTPDGRWLVALTCAACHSSTAPDGDIIAGLPNAALRLAELQGGHGWRPGTMDVTPDAVDNPVRPPDLRALAHQARMHHTGNLNNGRIERMVRIETLIVGRRSFVSRPPRVIVAAMALYLESLARDLPQLDENADGAAPFRRECGSCHRGAELSGPPVPVDHVGTDPAATTTNARGTGGYRAPSLRGVSGRRGLLHDGSAASLDAVLGLAESAHVGHPFGRDLPEATRRAIRDYLAAGQ